MHRYNIEYTLGSSHFCQISMSFQVWDILKSNGCSQLPPPFHVAPLRPGWGWLLTCLRHGQDGWSYICNSPQWTIYSHIVKQGGIVTPRDVTNHTEFSKYVLWLMASLVLCKCGNIRLQWWEPLTSHRMCTFYGNVQLFQGSFRHTLDTDQNCKLLAIF